VSTVMWKEDLISAAHVLGEVIILVGGFFAASLVFVPPGIIPNHPLFGLFISAFTWFCVYVIAALVYDGVKAAINRYTDVWSECGKHGSPAE